MGVTSKHAGLRRWRINTGLLQACLPASLISVLSIHCSTVVASITQKHVAPSTSAGILELRFHCHFCIWLRVPWVAFLPGSLTFPWHLPTFVTTCKRPNSTVYQKHGSGIKAVKCQTGSVHLAPVAPDLTWNALWEVVSSLLLCHLFLCLWTMDLLTRSGKSGSLKLFSFAISSKILMEIKVLGLGKSGCPVKMLPSKEDWFHCLN